MNIKPMKERDHRFHYGKKISFLKCFDNNSSLENLPDLLPLILVLMKLDMSCFANSADPDQLASKLFVIRCVNLYQQCESSNLIGL